MPELALAGLQEATAVEGVVTTGQVVVVWPLPPEAAPGVQEGVGVTALVVVAHVVAT